MTFELFAVVVDCEAVVVGGSQTIPSMITVVCSSMSHVIVAFSNMTTSNSSQKPDSIAVTNPWPVVRTLPLHPVLFNLEPPRWSLHTQTPSIIGHEHTSRAASLEPPSPPPTQNIKTSIKYMYIVTV